MVFFLYLGERETEKSSFFLETSRNQGKGSKSRQEGGKSSDREVPSEKSKFFFISSSWNGYIDCNIKSGDPGFVKIIDKGTIEYPEYDGNSMYRTAGNV